MSRLLDQARRYAQQAGPFVPEDGQLPAYREGVAFATEIVAELCKPNAPARLLFIGFGMAAAAGDDAFASGFQAELQRLLAAGGAA